MIPCPRRTLRWKSVCVRESPSPHNHRRSRQAKLLHYERTTNTNKIDQRVSQRAWGTERKSLGRGREENQMRREEQKKSSPAEKRLRRPLVPEIAKIELRMKGNRARKRTLNVGLSFQELCRMQDQAQRSRLFPGRSSASQRERKAPSCIDTV